MKKESLKMESLSDSKFDSLDCNEMTKIVGGMHTVTCTPQGNIPDDGDDSGWMNENTFQPQER